MISPRVTSPMIGLGLLEAIPAEDILAPADLEDASGDGISGRQNIVWSVEHDRPVLGRFGWKAGTPRVRQQSAQVFVADMGLSTTLLPEGFGECTTIQADCQAAEDGGDPVGDDALDRATFYARNLAVPARRDVEDARCCAARRCSIRLVAPPATRPSSSPTGWPTGRIRASADLALQRLPAARHGAGPADGWPEGRVTGTEWRTAPL